MAKKLQYHVTVESPEGELKTFGPDDTLPAWAAKKITNPSAWAGGDGDDQADEDQDGTDGDVLLDEEKPYAQWLKADLLEELDRRNEGRADDQQIEVEGRVTVKSIAAALDADDEATDGSSDDGGNAGDGS